MIGTKSMAYHFLEAGLVGQTANYLQKAGDRALANFANQEALAYSQQAVEIREGQRMTGEMADALFGLGKCQLATSHAGALKTGIGNLTRAFDYYASTGNVANAVAIAEHPLPTGAFLQTAASLWVSQALALVEHDSHEEGRLAARNCMYLGRMSTDYEGAKESFDRALRIALREGDVDLELLALANMAEVDLFHLQIEQSQKNAKQAIETAQKVIACYWNMR